MAVKARQPEPWRQQTSMTPTGRNVAAANCGRAELSSLDGPPHVPAVHPAVPADVPGVPRGYFVEAIKA
jgi:hypothetical protein